MFKIHIIIFIIISLLIYYNINNSVITIIFNFINIDIHKEIIIIIFIFSFIIINIFFFKNNYNLILFLIYNLIVAIIFLIFINCDSFSCFLLLGESTTILISCLFTINTKY